MPKTAKNLQTKSLLSHYNELNERGKEHLKEAFLKTFDYQSKDTFYRKIRQKSPLWNLEKEFFAKHFNTTIENLFP